MHNGPMQQPKNCFLNHYESLINAMAPFHGFNWKNWTKYQWNGHTPTKKGRKNNITKLQRSKNENTSLSKDSFTEF